MESKNKLLLVANPISGNSGNETLLKQLELEVAHRNLVLLKYETTGNESDDKKNILKYVITHHIRHILVMGGDGTIKFVAETIYNQDISIGILPAGSANGLASNLKLTDDVETQIQIALGAHSIAMDLLSINGHICLHIADVGINAELIENFENSPLRGKLGYALQTIPTLITSEYPYHFKIQTNNETLEKEGILIAIANAKQFGTGAMINPHGKLDDGVFEVVIFKKLDVVDIFKTLNQNSEMDSDFMEFRSTTKAVITSKKSISLQIDGEFIGKTTKIEASILQRKLKIMVPKDF
ncbi:YegS/Rv2252/BmrU family lipid kinase [Mariniflexile fucanivorans]|uniref:YegS/Rv2252/BmrU family lipid kinase n=1 Tax=Mariniflexile fucanivorans TaxID=264023 RepID=A0A4R1RNQ3_9FLAO|nr:diacylglycerol kinase family protein [Mariniflexile fucanivorans]TCL67844.1 YegS/Rv2252/BmrU family lipid kinase [Mariniflexile fucanivorans]